MTDDTRKALEIIKPIADELGISVEAYDDSLLVDDVKIGIACNSTYATIVEIIGYLFEKVWMKDRGRSLEKSTVADIRRVIERYFY